MSARDSSLIGQKRGQRSSTGPARQQRRALGVLDGPRLRHGLGDDEDTTTTLTTMATGTPQAPNEVVGERCRASVRADELADEQGRAGPG